MTNYDQFKAAELLINHPELWKVAFENITAKANALTIQIAGDPLLKSKTQHYSWTSQSELLNALKDRYDVLKKATAGKRAAVTRAANLSPERQHQIAVRKQFNKDLKKINYMTLNWKDFNLRNYAIRWLQAGREGHNVADMLAEATFKALCKLEKIERAISNLNELIKSEGNELSERQWSCYVNVVKDKLKNCYDRLLTTIKNAGDEHGIPTDYQKVQLLKSAFITGLKKVEKQGHVIFVERELKND